MSSLELLTQLAIRPNLNMHGLGNLPNLVMHVSLQAGMSILVAQAALREAQRGGITPAPRGPEYDSEVGVEWSTFSAVPHLNIL